MYASRKAYNLYRYAGSVAARTGAGNLIRYVSFSLSDRLDAILRRLINRRLPTTCVIDGMTIAFPAEGYFGIEIASGHYEPKTTRVFQQLIRPGMTIADVGAHVGYYTLVAASALVRRQAGGSGVSPGISSCAAARLPQELADHALEEKGSIYSFEPDPITGSFLKQNVVANAFGDLVEVVPKAVSNRTGDAQLFIGRRDRVANSIFAVPGASRKAVQCEVTTLDDFFRDRGWPQVNVLKMDVEGAEHAVLQGMAEMSARSPDLKLILEFFPANLQTTGVEPEEFFATLKGLGFSRIAMILDGLQPLTLPQDIPVLLRHCGPAFVNLLCEKE